MPNPNQPQKLSYRRPDAQDDPDLSDVIRTGERFVDPKDPEYPKALRNLSSTYQPMQQEGLTNWFNFRFTRSGRFSLEQSEHRPSYKEKKLVAEVYRSVDSHLKKMKSKFSGEAMSDYEGAIVHPLAILYRTNKETDSNHGLDHQDVVILCEAKTRNGDYFAPYRDYLAKRRIVVTSPGNPVLFIVGVKDGYAFPSIHPVFSPNAILEQTKALPTTGYPEQFALNKPVANAVLDEAIEQVVGATNYMRDVDSPMLSPHHIAKRMEDKIGTLAKNLHTSADFIGKNSEEITKVFVTLNCKTPLYSKRYEVYADEVSGTIKLRKAP